MKKDAQTSSLLQIWLKTYLCVILCYLPFLFYYLWGNHDWSWIKEGTPLWSGIFEGRFSQFFLPNILFSGQILPFFSMLTGLAAFSLSVILMLNLWHLPHKHFLSILLCTIAVTTPYTLSWFYFSFLTLSCLTWPLVIISAFTILQKDYSKPLSIAGATTLFTLALGGYPPVINMMGTLFITLILIDFCQNNLSILKLIRKYLPHVTAIIFSIILFLLIEYFLKKAGLLQNTYNTAGVELNSIPQQLKAALIESLTQFTYTTSFISATYKYLSLFLLILALYRLFYDLPKNTKNIIFFAILILALLLASVFTTLIAENTRYVWQEPRIKFFTLPFFNLFSCAILLHKTPKFTLNIAFICIIALLLNNTVTNFYAAKVWLFGNKAEAAFSERFISRLEEQEGFAPATNQYTFIQSGTISFRPKYYLPQKNTPEDSYTLTAPYIPWHLPYKAYTFYYPYSFVNQDFDVYWQTVNPAFINITPNLVQYLTKSSFPWPHQNAIYFSSDLIILTQSPEGKKSGADWYQKNFMGYPH